MTPRKFYLAAALALLAPQAQAGEITSTEGAVAIGDWQPPVDVHDNWPRQRTKSAPACVPNVVLRSQQRRGFNYYNSVTTDSGTGDRYQLMTSPNRGLHWVTCNDGDAS